MCSGEAHECCISLIVMSIRKYLCIGYEVYLVHSFGTSKESKVSGKALIGPS